MIVREQPSALQLFFLTQGSVVPKIIGKIISVALLSVLILLIDHYVVTLPHISIAAMGVFGVALSLFLGFRNNAAYDRWWEARKLLGSIVADVRKLGRDVFVFVERSEDRDYILCHAVAFTHLNRGNLRRVDVTDDIQHWVGQEETDTLSTLKNGADAALREIANRIGQLRSRAAVSEFGSMEISQTLSSLGQAQAGCERIFSTPLPFVYSLLVRRTTYLYCWLLPFALIESTSWLMPLFAAVVAYVFFGLQEVTNELEHPFRAADNGLPLDALCRVVEISVSEALGRPAPENIRPSNHLLT